MLPAEPVPSEILRSYFQAVFLTTVSCVLMLSMEGDGRKLYFCYRGDIVHGTVWVRRTFKDQLAQPFCSKQGCLPLDQVLRAWCSLILNVPRHENFTTPLQSLFNYFATLIVKYIFLMCILSLPSFSFKPLSYDPSQQTLL